MKTGDQVKQFCDLPDPIGTFERLFRAALESLLPDLAKCPWYVREHEVVNLFVFGQLVPRFRDEQIDIRQLGIEVPVQKNPESEKAKLGRNGDIVVWPHVEATVWRTCKALAVIEWKNISSREKRPSDIKRDHAGDVDFLRRNATLISVGYAVLTDQRGMHVTVSCKRIRNKTTEDLFPEVLGGNITEDCAVGRRTLMGDYKPIRLRAQGCTTCIPTFKR